MSKIKRPLLSEIPPAFKCLNCDEQFEPERHVRLYCTQLCSDEAKFVRYFRGCKADGRIKKHDVREAIKIRLAHIMAGGYDAKKRDVPSDLRTAVFVRDFGICQKCGQPGTQVDHISGDYNTMENLQVLCRDCHNAKTNEQIVEITPEHPQYHSLIKQGKMLRFRGNAPFPLRLCDDEKRWREINQSVMVLWRVEKTKRLAESLLKSLDQEKFRT